MQGDDAASLQQFVKADLGRMTCGNFFSGNIGIVGNDLGPVAVRQDARDRAANGTNADNADGFFVEIDTQRDFGAFCPLTGLDHRRTFNDAPCGSVHQAHGHLRDRFALDFRLDAGDTNAQLRAGWQMHVVAADAVACQQAQLRQAKQNFTGIDRGHAGDDAISRRQLFMEDRCRRIVRNVDANQVGKLFQFTQMLREGNPKGAGINNCNQYFFTHDISRKKLNTTASLCRPSAAGRFPCSRAWPSVSSTERAPASPAAVLSATPARQSTVRQVPDKWRRFP